MPYTIQLLYPFYNHYNVTFHALYDVGVYVFHRIEDRWHDIYAQGELN